MNLLNTKIIKIDVLTIYFLVILFLCGYVKVGIMVFLIVLWHEIGHVVVAKLWGFKILNVTIYPFGGITKLEKDINTPLIKEISVALAGIFFQIILNLVVGVIPFGYKTLILFYKYNMSIMLFNLIPIIPLDGSRLMECILAKFLPFKRAYLLNILISGLGILGYLGFNYWFSLNNYLLVGLFLIKIIERIKNFKYIWYRFLLERYIHNYNYKYIKTSKGNLDILKIDTYQYFRDEDKIRGEREKLKDLFDK